MSVKCPHGLPVATCAVPWSYRHQDDREPIVMSFDFARVARQSLDANAAVEAIDTFMVEVGLLPPKEDRWGSAATRVVVPVFEVA